MNAARAEDQAQPDGLPVLPSLPGVVTFVEPGYEGGTVGVPVLLPGPANGVQVGPDCPCCDGDGG